MPSSFAAQQQGSCNPHQNPVRSHKGGYLRCPFNISSSYAELAERRVHEDLACGRSRAAVADKDGVKAFPSTGPQVDSDGIDGDFAGRPWSRAGVGANRLSGKEKRTQQEQAEHIYGRGTLAEDDGAVAATGAVSVTSDLLQENMFAVDVRERAALQKVVPRAVREQVKRRKLEDVKKERLSPGNHCRHGCAPLHTDRAAGEEAGEDDDVESRSEDHMAGPPRERTRFSSPAAGSSRVGAPPLPHSAGSKDHPSGGSSSANVGAERSPRSGPSDASAQRPPLREPTPAPVSAKSNCPKNRMQMLDGLRASALMNKKGRR
ncbi:conserved hypothetical protein [Leishmania major strain Friedlin]|uniref:Uncharacterized protein n=1 Tax=Leishmania major TaxID=5664 RepID=Q4Q7H0_LEIMA|nr:conserved hypothetical protein [Leishmania major strain Friedlin]CAG9578330.1 hypothetical_protein_-_conserved [Leishmania major strain Friedlin]CAJ06206.1 conserved hypothetical protein [Leishmania major strain Friedlin]|eukprot:XP_001684728.1 conserved hypothetical protein [Leishmania major strain Friedlin]